MTLSAQPLLNGLSIGAVYAALALAVVLSYRATGVVNFAQGEMATFSAFIAWSFLHTSGGDAWLRFIVDPSLRFWVGVLATLAVAALLGAAVERVIIRPVEGATPLALVIVTLGLFEIFNSSSSFIWQSQPKPFPTPFTGPPLHLLGASLGRPQVGLFAVVAILLAAIATLFRGTRLGLALRATAENPEIAGLMGVPVGRMRMLGWALASMVGAVAGIFVANIVLLEPGMMLGPLLFAFAAAVLGGLENPVGAVAGGLFVGVIQNLAGATDLFKQVRDPVAFLIILGALVIRPSGLLGRRPVARV